MLLPLLCVVLLTAVPICSGWIVHSSSARVIASGGMAIAKMSKQKPFFSSTMSLHMSSSPSANEEEVSIPGAGTIGAIGVVSNIICAYSLYVLKTTSCGLPPGPFGLLGAAEGISYLAVVGILIWSLVKKVSTGSGLPAGPNGLLGAAEGLSFLTVIAGIAIGYLNYNDYGFLPGFLPNDKCFGINS